MSQTSKHYQGRMWRILTRKMKDSGIEWIGEIPEDWNVVPVKTFYQNKKEIVGEREEQFERLALTLNGVIKRSKDDGKGLQPEKFETYQVLYKDELIFKLIDLENVRTSRVGYSNYTGIVSPVYVRLINPDESKFGYYYFINMWHQEIFNYLGSGVRSNLTANELLKVPYLDIKELEKKNIIKKLDIKTKGIKLLLEQTRQSIEELKKYKQSLITEAVTKGLDPNVEMKDSGIEWIGKIPKLWSVRKISNYFSQVKDKNDELEEENLLSLSYGSIIRRNINSTDGLLPANFKNYNLVKFGDIVLRMTDLQNDKVSLRTGFVTEDGIITSAYITIRTDLDNNVLPKYIQLLLHSFDIYKGFYGMGSGVRQNVTYNDIKKIEIIVPPLNEQRQIVSYLDEQTSRIDKLIEDKTKVIEELEDYKKSLIYEYVTGKKEV